MSISTEHLLSIKLSLLRLGKERTRLQAMMQHLHMKHSPDTTTPALGKNESTIDNIPSTSNCRIEDRAEGIGPPPIQVLIRGE